LKCLLKTIIYRYHLSTARTRASRGTPGFLANLDLLVSATGSIWLISPEGFCAEISTEELFEGKVLE